MFLFNSFWNARAVKIFHSSEIWKMTRNNMMPSRRSTINIFFQGQKQGLCWLNDMCWNSNTSTARDSLLFLLSVVINLWCCCPCWLLRVPATELPWSMLSDLEYSKPQAANWGGQLETGKFMLGSEIGVGIDTELFSFERQREVFNGELIVLKWFFPWQ